MLSPEGINIFVAGEQRSVRHLLEVLRRNPLLADLDVKESYSDKQPFNRMLVKLKREIIAFGIDEVRPAVRTSPKLKAVELKQWLSEGRKFRLLDTRNVYEIELGTFQNAEHLHIHHFRDFPEAIANLPEETKQVPIVMFCTGGIRCEKATAFVKGLGIEDVFHLKGGILKYLEEVPQEDSRWEGECFVFDERVSVGHGLIEGEAELCRACRSPLTLEAKQSPHYEAGVSCPACYDKRTEEDRARYAERQKQIRLAQKRGERHIGK